MFPGTTPFSSSPVRTFLVASALLGCLSPGVRAQPADSTVAVRIDAAESHAVLAILAKKGKGQAITDADWERLYATDGYRRLKKREASFHREFTDTEFAAFVLSDSLAAKYESLKSTLEKWEHADVSAAAARALAYLPAGSRIHATIYPVIKPRSNSFVFEPTKDPAIFLYLNPAVTPAKFENTLAHELHHIGYANGCGAEADKIAEDSTLSMARRTVLEWIGAFGEGFAMLAAAGGPDINPHAVSPPEERARWDADMLHVNDSLRAVDRFFQDILADRLTPEQVREKAFSFFGIQGPWYTVGWKMAVTIEKAFGRPRLIACLCDPRLLLPTYNEAAEIRNRPGKGHLATWSAVVINSLRNAP